jgi:hypothetical protein
LNARSVLVTAARGEHRVELVHAPLLDVRLLAPGFGHRWP